MADIFSADEIINKTLIAAKDVPIFRYGSDTAPQIGIVKAGQPVGVVYSWLDPAPEQGRAGLWWVFYQSNNQYYYTPHVEGNFSISALQEQGAVSTEEKIRRQQEQEKLNNMSLPEQILYKYGWWLAVPVILFAAPGIIKALKPNDRS